MTLLATTLVPDIEQLKGSAHDMIRTLSDPMGGVVLSFAVSGIYWISQQRRLAMTKVLAGWQTLLHLFFLFLIVLLPISTGLFVRNGSTAGSVTIFGTHLTLISAVNLMLWIDLHRQVRAWAAIIPAALGLAWLSGTLAVGLVRPELAQYFWYGAFSISPLTHIARRAAFNRRRRNDPG